MTRPEDPHPGPLPEGEGATRPPHPTAEGATPPPLPLGEGWGEGWRRTLLITSAQLFAGAREVQIDHHGAVYRLKQTSLGKLILTK